MSLNYTVLYNVCAEGSQCGPRRTQLYRLHTDIVHKTTINSTTGSIWKSEHCDITLGWIYTLHVLKVALSPKCTASFREENRRQKLNITPVLDQSHIWRHLSSGWSGFEKARFKCLWVHNHSLLTYKET